MTTIDEIRAVVDAVFNQYYEPDQYPAEREAAAREFHDKFPDRDASVFERWVIDYYGIDHAVTNYITYCELRRLEAEVDRLQAVVERQNKVIEESRYVLMVLPDQRTGLRKALEQLDQMDKEG